MHFNSKGAVIVDDPNVDGQANDIYFPNHTAEVSHIAVDVSPMESVDIDWWVACKSSVFHTRPEK